MGQTVGMSRVHRAVIHNTSGSKGLADATLISRMQRNDYISNQCFFTFCQASKFSKISKGLVWTSLKSQKKRSLINIVGKTLQNNLFRRLERQNLSLHATIDLQISSASNFDAILQFDAWLTPGVKFCPEGVSVKKTLSSTQYY